MRAMASELRMCPPIWKAVSGRVVRIRSRVGLRIGYFRAGMAVLTAGKREARKAERMQKEETKAN